jgi:hypothetical protein
VKVHVNALTRHIQLRLRDVVPDAHKDAVLRGIVSVYLSAEYRVWPVSIIGYVVAKVEDPAMYVREAIAQAGRADEWLVVSVPSAPGFMVVHSALVEDSWATYRSASASLPAHEVLLEMARGLNMAEGTQEGFDQFCLQLEDRVEDTVPTDKREEFVVEMADQLCGPRMCLWPLPACQLMINIFGSAGAAAAVLQPLVAKHEGWSLTLDGEDIVVKHDEKCEALPKCDLCGGGALPVEISMSLVNMILDQCAYGGGPTDGGQTEGPGPDEGPVPEAE